MKMIKKCMFKYVHPRWNIGIAEQDEDLCLRNIKWVRHNYKDRWFADPFILYDTTDTYVILAEEFLYDSTPGRIVRLTVSKSDLVLLDNELILELSSHLSFPIAISIKDKIYVYPENGASGKLRYYEYGDRLLETGILIDRPLADPVIFKGKKDYFLLATKSHECNGNKLTVFRSDEALGDYIIFDEILFKDNIARRAGNIFSWKDMIISPAQICNDDYGEGVSLQVIEERDDKLVFQEIKRLMPVSQEYPDGFHTYNVYKDNIVIIDGYKYFSKFLYKLYTIFKG